MKRLLAYGALVLVSAAIASTLGFAVGARVGFFEGFLVGTHQNEVVSAGVILAAIKARQKGKPETADALLEGRLNSAALVHWGYLQSHSKRPLYAPEQFYLDVTRSLANIAEYRRDHPHDIQDEAVRRAVHETLARYEPSSPEP